MRPHACFVFVLLAFVPAILASPVTAQEPASDPVILRLGGDPGQTSRYRHEKRLSLHLPEELGSEVTTRTVLRLD
ncbi:MAG: hypothetical protein ACWGON_07310, partial [Gemmatimonadota bacterium]